MPSTFDEKYVWLRLPAPFQGALPRLTRKPFEAKRGTLSFGAVPVYEPSQSSADIDKGGRMLAVSLTALPFGIFLLIVGARLRTRQGTLFHEAVALSEASLRRDAKICIVAGLICLMVAAVGLAATLPA